MMNEREAQIAKVLETVLGGRSIHDLSEAAQARARAAIFKAVPREELEAFARGGRPAFN